MFKNCSTDKLLVTCDDCGLSTGINLATVDLYQRGLVTSVSLLTNFSAFSHAIELFPQCPSLAIGIHLNLTEGFPVAAISPETELTDSTGRFRSRFNLFYKAAFPTKSFLRTVEIEFAAQIETLLNLGIEPRHLTTHLHFHMFPSLRKIVEQQAVNYKIPWVRNHQVSRTVMPFNPLLDKKIELESSRDGTPQYLAGLRYWVGQDLRPLVSLLTELKGVIELVVHASYEQDTDFPKYISYPPPKRFMEVQTLQVLHDLLTNVHKDKG